MANRDARSSFSAHFLYPQPSDLTKDVARVELGAETGCALMEGMDRQLKCWGQSWVGAAQPVRYGVVDVTDDVADFSLFWTHICVVKTDQSVWCWGYGTDGKLGTGDTSNRSVPTRVLPANSGARMVATGESFTCVGFADGRVKCWGSDNRGQLGNGGTGNVVTATAATAVAGVTIDPDNLESLLAGRQHACALIPITQNGGGVRCWGRGEYGRLGNGQTGDSHVAVVVDEDALFGL